ncbi:hypothetical protein ACJX0J_031726, partial [Zea mays]
MTSHLKGFGVTFFLIVGRGQPSAIEMFLGHLQQTSLLKIVLWYWVFIYNFFCDRGEYINFLQLFTLFTIFTAFHLFTICTAFHLFTHISFVRAVKILLTYLQE